MIGTLLKKLGDALGNSIFYTDVPRMFGPWTEETEGAVGEHNATESLPTHLEFFYFFGFLSCQKVENALPGKNKTHRTVGGGGGYTSTTSTSKTSPFVTLQNSPCLLPHRER